VSATQLNGIVRIQKNVGPAVTVGDVTVTPLSQAVLVRLPFAAFVWHRPTGVLVERAGVTERVPVPNVTRAIIWGLLGLGLAISVVFQRRHR
jgi:hypothetical protein